MSQRESDQQEECSDKRKQQIGQCMRGGLAAAHDQEIRRKGDHLPDEEELQAGGSARQRRQRKKQHGKKRVEAWPLVAAIKACDRKHDAAAVKQDCEKIADPRLIADQPHSADQRSYNNQ